MTKKKKIDAWRTGHPFKSERYMEEHSKKRNWKTAKHILSQENYKELPPHIPNYGNIEAPVSMYPAKHYCDLTGFEAKYKDPRTQLRYCSADQFQSIRELPEHTVQEYLSLRKAGSSIK
eukprot:gb/GECH01013329.1/.p1 GENE.gb/GECH01013329.1/~~gb/GECH01013329.1/.p1  ORF type:complete len:119 (+),score=22.69 gb/GECH01013329.1/:1-357(+)